VTVAKVDWSVFRQVYEARGPRPLLERLRGTEPSKGARTNGVLRTQLEGTQPAKRAELLVAHLRTRVARVLGLESAEALDPGHGFFELGMDSLMSVQLRRWLESDLGQPLSPTLAFDYPSVASLADHLARLLFSGSGAEPDPAKPARPQEIGDLLEKIEHLPEEEVDVLLERSGSQGTLK
jgi:acyl carrier protein